MPGSDPSQTPDVVHLQSGSGQSRTCANRLWHQRGLGRDGHHMQALRRSEGWMVEVGVAANHVIDDPTEVVRCVDCRIALRRAAPV
ncbi:MAG: hypothetical protein CL424_07595 [Acidimicrobiaceae bacterium]|nr:hypothetical protein [Acidimicrobiaceae bacterium]